MVRTRPCQHSMWWIWHHSHIVLCNNCMLLYFNPSFVWKPASVDPVFIAGWSCGNMANMRHSRKGVFPVSSLPFMLQNVSYWSPPDLPIHVIATNLATAYLYTMASVVFRLILRSDSSGKCTSTYSGSCMMSVVVTCMFMKSPSKSKEGFVKIIMRKCSF